MPGHAQHGCQLRQNVPRLRLAPGGAVDMRTSVYLSRLGSVAMEVLFPLLMNVAASELGT
jgi:hypothetical protein